MVVLEHLALAVGLHGALEVRFLCEESILFIFPFLLILLDIDLVIVVVGHPLLEGLLDILWIQEFFYQVFVKIVFLSILELHIVQVFLFVLLGDLLLQGVHCEVRDQIAILVHVDWIQLEVVSLFLSLVSF